MQYQVLARKWRPKTFTEVIGQDHIVQTLKNSIDSGRIAHAYLFAGTRGVGKTTIARIFAKALRCQNLQNSEPCLTCPSCLSMDSGSDIDYIEIDGASNNGVENIRELIENVHFLPTNGKYKVYVIDEVHMLSTGAFNALLKTLEEPPEHVVFLFATTDPQKLLATVLSRCQRLDFKYVNSNVLEKHIAHIADKEGIRFENTELIKELCKHGRGSVRDTLSLLDQVLSMTLDKMITDDLFYQSLGLANKDILKSILSNLLVGNTYDVVNEYHKIKDRNIELKSFLNQLLSALHLCVAEIENPEALYQRGVLADGCLDSIEYAEIFWIYEAIAKDADWLLKSIDPVNILEVMLRKITMRRELLSKDNTQKKKPIAPKPVKDWPGFIKYAYEKAAATAANLERGNITRALDFSGDVIEIELGFKGDGSKVFIDYLTERETNQKVQGLMRDYFEQSKKFSFKCVQIDGKKNISQSFLSQAEINEKNEQERINKREDQVRDNLRIVEAMELFGSKVDKVMLNEAKK